MTRHVRSVGIWTPFDAVASTRAMEAAQQLEELGYAALWIPEGIGRDPFVSAAQLLTATTRLCLASGIANVYARDAMAMRACQLTLGEAFPGRFLLGLGVSSAALVEKVRGHAYEKPFTFMCSYLSMMDAAMYRAQQPSEPPKRVLGALGPKMLALSASSADGAHTFLTTPDHTRAARDIIGPDAILAPEQMVVLTKEPSTARTIGRAAISAYLRSPGYIANLRRMGFTDDDWVDPKVASERLVDSVIAWGDVDEIAARVRAHHDAGADHVAIQVLRCDRELPTTEWCELAPALIGG